jgi:hypothetical protein
MTEVLPFDPSNRIKVVSQADMLAPAQCAVCQSVSCELGFIDSDLQIEWYGGIYFCGYCAINIAQAMGCATPSETRDLRANLDAAQEALTNALHHNSELEGALDALSLTRLAERSDPISRSLSDSNDLEVNAGSDQLSSDAEQVEGRADSESSEPSKVDGPDDISDDADPNGINALIGL